MTETWKMKQFKLWLFVFANNTVILGESQESTKKCERDE